MSNEVLAAAEELYGLYAALTRTAEASELTTRTVTAYFAGLLAASQGRVLVANNRPGGFRLSTPPR